MRTGRGQGEGEGMGVDKGRCEVDWKRPGVARDAICQQEQITKERREGKEGDATEWEGKIEKKITWV